MNTIQPNEGLEKKNQRNALGHALNSCKAVLAQINHVKDAILTEARNTLAAPEQLVRLALNEAEALAYQTRYPQLVFADLAEEKIQRTAAWSERQLQLD
jgi:hypothetical protein